MTASYLAGDIKMTKAIVGAWRSISLAACIIISWLFYRGSDFEGTYPELILALFKAGDLVPWLEVALIAMACLLCALGLTIQPVRQAENMVLKLFWNGSISLAIAILGIIFEFVMWARLLLQIERPYPIFIEQHTLSIIFLYISAGLLSSIAVRMLYRAGPGK